MPLNHQHTKKEKKIAIFLGNCIFEVIEDRCGVDVIEWQVNGTYDAFRAPHHVRANISFNLNVSMTFVRHDFMFTFKVLFLNSSHLLIRLLQFEYTVQ